MSYLKKDTKNCLVKIEDDMEKFIGAVTRRTASFLKWQFEFEIFSERYEFQEEKYINLIGITSIISIEDYNKITVLFNYDDLLLKEIFIRYTKNIKVEEIERQLYIDETASDLINVIIGNVLSEFEKLDVVIDISTPLIIREAEFVTKFKDTKAYSTKIKTEFGQMKILCIVPGDEFLNQFGNLKG